MSLLHLYIAFYYSPGRARASRRNSRLWRNGAISEPRSTKGSSVTGASDGGTMKRLARMPHRSLDPVPKTVRGVTIRFARPARIVMTGRRFSSQIGRPNLVRAVDLHSGSRLCPRPLFTHSTLIFRGPALSVPRSVKHPCNCAKCHIFGSSSSNNNNNQNNPQREPKQGSLPNPVQTLLQRGPKSRRNRRMPITHE